VIKRFVYALVAVVFLALLIASSQTNPQAYGEEWWNGSWHYRVKITVNTSYYDRFEWPIEYEINFTSLLENLNITDTFDENSTRVVEVNSSGGVLYEMTSQFDKANDYDLNSNAAGTLIFILNGTTSSQTERWFYVYFDTLNDTKDSPSYSSIMDTDWDGDEFNITFNINAGDDFGFFTFDTNRSENTSGLYKYFLKDEYKFTYSGAGERTREYIQTSNGYVNLTHDLRGNASFVEGPVRITVFQEGYETYWNQADNRTNMTYLRKTYTFYPNKTWFIVEHEITNINDTETVNRSSYAGISGFDVLGAYGSGYKVDYNYSLDPGSTVSGAPSVGTERGGYAHIWENGTSNFRADNYTTGSNPNYDRIGINLSMTQIQPGESIQDRAIMVFYHTVNSPTLLPDTRDRLMNNVNISLGQPEMWVITVEPQPDHDIYNRNESAIMGANITRDDWSLVDYVNATLDMGTPAVSGDDVTIQLLDDGIYPDLTGGDDFYTSYYNFSDSETLGYWNMTVRAYDKDGSLLNESYYTFNVTAELWANITFWNQTGIYRVENATVNVTNFRQDIPIPNATTINCTAAGVQIPPGNITDHDNGTYTVTFQTPFDYGAYPLNCSFEKDGSWGFDLKNFTVESPETNISITPDPTIYHAYNVRFYDNESFNLKVTLKNIGNSSAYDLGFNFTLPSNLTSNYTSQAGYCGLLIIGDTCVRDFNITILNNSVAKNYTINITANWTNRIGSDDLNTSFVTVTVHENPILDVLEENVTGILPPGSTSQTIKNLLVRSLGNNATLNVNLTTIGFDPNITIEFDPQNRSIMGPGEEQIVQVRATVPSVQLPGIYEGEINVTSDNGGYETLNLTIVVTGTNLTIEVSPDSYDALNVTTFENESFEFSVNVTNTGNTTAFNSYVNVSLPTNWYINETNQSCGNMTKGSTCMRYFFVNITELTHAGNYTINVTIFWEDIGIAWKNETEKINVTVVSNVTLEVLEDGFEKTMEHGTYTVLGNMTVRSTGNDDIINVTFNLSQELENFTIEFNQSYPFNMTPGDFRTVQINATIPLGFDPGDYNGTLNVTSFNNGYKLLYLNITVPENGSWTTNTTFCEHAQSPETGVVCDMLINNTGNIMLNFTVTPPGANHTNASKTNFNVSKQNSTILTITYDMEGEAGQGYFLTNYTIDPKEAAADPDNITLEIVLNPFVAPLVEIGTIPDIQQQGGSVTIVVNVTSQAGVDFDVVRMTVERPNGTNDTVDLGFSFQVFWIGCDLIIDDPGDKLCYVVNYPSDLNGNSSDRGNYTVYVYANDTFAVNTTNTSVFQIYTRYIVYLDMPDTTQGKWESINYRAQDYLGAPLGGASVNLTIKDPDNRSMYMLSGNEYTTDESGWVSNNIFVIPAHATLGEYTIYSNGSWYDSQVDLWLNNETTSKFNVTAEERLTAAVAIPSPSYLDQMFTVSVIVLEYYNQPVDPDSINLTIYRTEGYNLDLWRQLDMTNFNRSGLGFYKYSEVISSGSVLTGTYLALLKVNLGDKETYDIQAFRISAGGPYDVFLDLVQAEVAQGRPLEFDITIWNKGEIDHQDVLTQYWVYGNGQSWDSSSFSTNILGGENKTFRRSVFIFSNQPPGFYTLNAEVTYDPAQPPATANTTFLVTGVARPEEPGDGAGAPAPPPAPPSVGKINITTIPEQVGVMAGIPRQFNIKVEAVGGAIHNIWLDFQGIPDDWVITDPVNITQLAAGDSAVISVQITAPRGESGERKVRVVAHSTESTDSRDMILRIFTSRKDLINFELTRLRAKLEELRDRSDKAREQGFDTTQVDDILDDAESEIRLAEGYLKEELYDASLESIYTAWRLLEEAEDLLEKMFLGITVPWWVFLIIIFALIITGLIFLYRKISENLKIMIRGRISEARQVAGTVKGAGLEIEKLREERTKTSRMLMLLENQFKQGIISKEAYDSLKKRSEERIAELDKKIRESLRA
jgi:uncharacterized membrane protein